MITLLGSDGSILTRVSTVVVLELEISWDDGMILLVTSLLGLKKKGNSQSLVQCSNRESDMNTCVTMAFLSCNWDCISLTPDDHPVAALALFSSISSYKDMLEGFSKSDSSIDYGKLSKLTL